MFDIPLRRLKDAIFEPLAGAIPSFITPTQLTFVAFFLGSLASYFCAQNTVPLSLAFWILGRFLDCLDGAVARQRKTASDLGGFWDLLGDFVVYASIPISCAVSITHETVEDARADFLAVAMLEGAFFVNNFALFYMAAVAEKAAAVEGMSGAKGKRKGKGKGRSEELTSLMMRPALVEGAESAGFFTLMLMFPERLRVLAYVMFGGVVIGTAQRAVWFAGAFRDEESEKDK